MDKLKMHSKNKADENFRKLLELFPNAITETIDENGDVIRAIDKDVLMQEINTKVIDGKEERYQFTWPDKKKSVLLANAPIAKTLRPCRKDSIDFDNTENLYIEGDNLDVLKLLQETYLGKIKVIYIDPPYNSGNDFVYNDNFCDNSSSYIANSGQLDDEGNKLVQNTENNGRFHTNWLNMMYPRLKIAKNLLSDTGVIFISIDDHELENMKKICNEVFGEQNFSALFLWTKTSTPPSLSYKSRKTVEYVLCYEKNLNKTKYFGSLLDGGDVPLLNSGNPIKKLTFPIGSVRFYFIDNGMLAKGKYEKAELLDDVCICDNINQNEFSMKAEFKWSQDMLNTETLKGTSFVIKTNKMSIRFIRTTDDCDYKTPNNFLNLELNREIGIGTNESALKELESLGFTKIFDFPKPVSLIKYLINMITKFEKDAYVMDFFSGSATTAHAVMDLNANDGGHRKFILVQVNELTYKGQKEYYLDSNGVKQSKYIYDQQTGYPIIEKDSEARKCGFFTITEIGKERLRRAIKMIKSNFYLSSGNIDLGFRVLKCDSTNMKDVFYTPESYELKLFSDLTDNIKEDRTSQDLLFQVMLELGVLLSSKIEEKKISEKNVFFVENNYLIACFDQNISDDVITEIAKQKPYYFVMRDSGFEDDSVATNFEQIFSTYSPGTVKKVL